MHLIFYSEYHPHPFSQGGNQIMLLRACVVSIDSNQDSFGRTLLTVLMEDGLVYTGLYGGESVPYFPNKRLPTPTSV